MQIAHWSPDALRNLMLGPPDCISDEFGPITALTYGAFQTVLETLNENVCF